jgi:uncharacterized membrane protein YeaQ/YmgE (transglycosylase-associated protein family)
LGTAVGILLAYIILSNNGNEYNEIFLYSLIPAIIGVLFILFVKEKRKGIEERQYH